MNVPFVCGQRVPARDWQDLRLRSIFEFCKWDIQSEDHSVLADFPLFLDCTAWNNVSRLAEELSSEALSAEAELQSRPDLQKKLGVPSCVRTAMRRDQVKGSAAVRRCRLMRFDFHYTTEGWRVSEVNADVPGGLIEGSGFAKAVADYCGAVAPPDPVREYTKLIAQISGDGVVGLVHATAHYDDRQMMEYLARHLRARGTQAILLSPGHLRWAQGAASIQSSFANGTPALLVRFFPAEWLPHLPSATWQSWFQTTVTPLSNPGTALLIQCKRFPLVWNELRTKLPLWRSLLPQTVDPSEAFDDLDNWVFKPAFGRVGEDVAIRGITSEGAFAEIAKAARSHPLRWVAQRRFETPVVDTPDGPRFVCLGVFTLDCRTIGAYGRIGSKPLIDEEAQDVAVLVH